MSTETNECPCAACDPGLILDGEYTPFPSRMNVCPDCGNKRCPKAGNHARWLCSGSNEPGQVGVHAARPAAQSDNRPDLFHMTVAAEIAATDAAKAARAAQDALAAPPVGVGTSGVGTGAPGGTHGLSLGDTLRHIADSEALVLGGYVMERLADRADALERELAEVRAAVVEIQPAEVLVEGSYFPVADLPQVLGNFIRSSAEYASQAKAAHVQVERVRALADKIEHADEFIGVHRKTIARKMRDALDGAQ